jgi:hypothetical protein
MARLVPFVFLLLAAGCQMPPDRLPARVLPEDSPPLPYAELLTRARLQSTAATEAFYINQWADLEEAARGLAQTARFLAKALEVPEHHKATLLDESERLGKEADRLREAAKNKDDKQVTEVLQKIHLMVRELRP